MMKLSHEVLLALAYVSQISDPDLLRSRFIESLSALDEGFSFAFADHLPSGIPECRIMPIATLRSSFGYAVMAENPEISESGLAVFRSAFKFLAIILENRMQARALESQNQSLLKEIKTEKSLVRTVLDTLPVGVWVADENGTILMGNAANEKIWTETPYKGWDWRACTGKGLNPEDWGISRAISAGETVAEQEIKIECCDGTHKTVLHSAAPLLNEEGTVIGAVGVNQDISGRKRAEEALRESEEKFKHIFESANVGKSVTSLTGEIDVNRAFCDLLGYTREELINRTWQEITPKEEVETIQNLLNPLLRGEKNSARFSKRYVHKNGSIIWADISVAMRRDSEGKPLHFITTVVDITERKRTEEEKEKLGAQLLHAQKMESVGRLAGGVAHDYNNMLSVILGYTEIALEKLEPESILRSDLEEVLKAARRSADITRQLLAFSRQQTIAPRLLSLNETLESMLKMLRHLIGENIELSWYPGENLWPVCMDPTQIDQILVNLCVNARDAISDTGKISIETDKTVFDEDYCANHAGFVPGDFVMLSVSDDGCGMDRSTMDKIFEPFFTTKELGRGTGLGLATVYGIVRQNSGFVNVYSEPGRGTTFRIYLPRHDIPAEKVHRKDSAAPDARGSETILLAEDDHMILRMTAMMLERLGYKVLAAGSPHKAINLATENAGRIQLLITDVVMPDMNGRELSERLRSLCPGIKVLFMSGYTANVIAHQGVLDKDVNFIHKPFTKQGLAVKVREILKKI